MKEKTMGARSVSRVSWKKVKKQRKKMSKSARRMEDIFEICLFGGPFVLLIFAFLNGHYHLIKPF